MKKLQKSLINSSAGLVILLAAPSLAAGEEISQQDLENQPTQLLAQATERPPTETPDILVPNPEIIIKSNTSQNDPLLNQGTVNVPVVPNLPRAVAPPVGDISVSNINAGADQVDLGTRAIVPRLVLRQAPAKEVLAVLARYAGLNLVFTDAPAASDPSAPGGGAVVTPDPTVSLDLANEPVQEVFNSVLMISGLKANRRGRTIFIGANLPNGARNLISRSLRLNQVKANSAGIFLASQGADFQRLVTQVQEITDPITNRVVRRVEQPAELKSVQGASTRIGGSPLLLTGLSVSTDDRLNTITLVGEPRQVEVATSFLTQLDVRRRQVAVNVKVIDINLRNTQDFNSSFSFGFNDGYFLQDNGAALLNFGNNNPASRAQAGQPGGFLAPIIPLASTIANPPVLEPFLDRVANAPFADTTSPFATSTASPRPNFGTFQNPFQPGVTDIPVSGPITYRFPGLFQTPNRFLLTIQTQIQNGNAKILTDPTLVVQEGQEATVRLTQKVLESVSTQVDPLSGVRTTTPVLADSGLILTVNIDKIDDNGFVNLSVSPSIASPGSTVQFSSGGAESTNTLTLLSRRELSSGLIRLRDSQTLILSGIITEADRTTVKKVPILGDIPILGALFRSTSSENSRQEVIILLTPQLINDNANSQFGYNFNPSPTAADLLKRQGFPLQK